MVWLPGGVFAFGGKLRSSTVWRCCDSSIVWLPGAGWPGGTLPVGGPAEGGLPASNSRSLRSIVWPMPLTVALPESGAPPDGGADSGEPQCGHWASDASTGESSRRHAGHFGADGLDPGDLDIAKLDHGATTVMLR